MVKITIDGIEIEVRKGTTVIQAADELGIEIPRYCYHPGLSIVGVCRICLVEIERIPKLQVACYTPVTDGMVVHTNNDNVRQARQAVLEFLLVNHPLDCPVCDQAGECWLQNFYMEYGRHDSQMIENKVKKHKALPVGPNVILDSERCILCTRCVRFCDEVSQTHELGIFDRGDHSELLPYPGRELDNKYAGNTIDICPVGALTDRDFRFRTRVWYLEETKSICPGCSNGCNIYIHHSEERPYKADGARIARLKPRFNPEVNDWWMCDDGRYGFDFIDAATRLTAPKQKVRSGWEELAWDLAISDVAQRLKQSLDRHGPESVGIILSPQMTNEGLYSARLFFNTVLKAQNLDYEVTPLEPGYADDFLIKADKHPNSKGAEILGLGAQAYGGQNVAQMLKAVTEKRVKVLYICYHDLENRFALSEIEAACKSAELVIFQGSNENATSALADYILPSATFAEQDGTFTNHSGRVQRIFKAVEPLTASKPDWWIFKQLAKSFGKAWPYFAAEDVFDALAQDVAEFAGLTYETIGEEGTALNGHNGTKEVEQLNLWRKPSG